LSLNKIKINLAGLLFTCLAITPAEGQAAKAGENLGAQDSAKTAAAPAMDQLRTTLAELTKEATELSAAINDAQNAQHIVDAFGRWDLHLRTWRRSVRRLEKRYRIKLLYAKKAPEELRAQISELQAQMQAVATALESKFDLIKEDATQRSKIKSSLIKIRDF
jgi:prefoldin subunit 5